MWLKPVRGKSFRFYCRELTSFYVGLWLFYVSVVQNNLRYILRRRKLKSYVNIYTVYEFGPRFDISLTATTTTTTAATATSSFSSSSSGIRTLLWVLASS